MMKAALLLYLKVFLLLGIPFGMFLSLFDLIIGLGFNLDTFIYRVCFFGTGMALLMVTMQLIGLRRLGIKNFTRENLKVIQTKTVKSSDDRQILISKLKADPTLAKMQLQEKPGEVDLSSDMSLWSWGETISIKSNPSAGINEYEIESRPKLKITLADFGRNMRNVNHIEKLLRLRSPSEAN